MRFEIDIDAQAAPIGVIHAVGGAINDPPSADGHAFEGWIGLVAVLRSLIYGPEATGADLD
jgi:hypothetical protein